MIVKAIATGYHGHLREPGDEFEVPKGSKASWFVPVSHPLDHDGDGRKGGSKPRAKAVEAPEPEAEAEPAADPLA